MGKGKLFIVSTPIGNLEDITLRALKVLNTVHLIAAEDTRRTRLLLNHYQIETPLISLHEHNEVKKGKTLIRRMEEGNDIAYVTDAGTPGISDPGFLLVKEALKEGIQVVPIPGPSAVISALVVSGLPLDAFVVQAFLPTKKGERRQVLSSLADETRTLVFFEAPHRLLDTLRDIREILGDRPMALARELTKVHEEVIRGSVGEVVEKIAGRRIRGEITLVVGGAGGAKNVPDEEIEEALLNLRKEGGLSARDRIERVAKEKGVSRSRVYAIDLKLKKQNPFS